MKKIEKALFVSRLSLAIVFIWFGVLKIIGVSPANELIQSLLKIQDNDPIKKNETKDIPF